ncbi:MAG TPA: chemotaxis protein CheW [Polyangiales bacterium]
MALYKGIELSQELASSIRYMEEVEEYREELRVLQAAWDNLALLGHLSGTHIDIGPVRSAFASLTADLVNHLGLAQRVKEERDLVSRAQVAIDVLVRNLYERTADIGFLATDLELRNFAAADPAERSARKPALLARFHDYCRKYTVYEDVVLLSPEGDVLARLADTPGPERTRDPLVRECLETRAAYVEVYRKCDLVPEHDRALLYAYRVLSPDETRTVGVLCLCFRFEDECERIFSGLVAQNEACVLGMLDARGHVLATSEPRELPVGARVPGGTKPGTVEVVRFAGRPFLAVTCATGGYQGYLGPGWSGFAMAPLEFVFSGSADERASLTLPDETLAQVLGSERLFSAKLRAIPAAALRIQAELHRAVWNGNVALAREQGAGTPFSKTLLGEIGATGARTRDVFARALDNLHRTVLSSTLRDVRARAALATDILDRNLYERANDCRWWALTPAFRSALEQRDRSDLTRRALTELLVTINGLYTVYTSLVLFDAEGRVVATSNSAHQDYVGTRLEAPWFEQTLRLQSSEDYCASAFEPSPLYDNKPSYVYLAAVRGLRAAGRVVGGIGIVFDTEPQLRAMLEAALPRDASGHGTQGAFGLYVDSEQRVVSSTRDDLAPGSRFSLDEGALLAPGEPSAARVLALGDTLYAVGSARCSGYREYNGPNDRNRNDVQGLIAVPLCAAARVAEARAQVRHIAPRAQLAKGTARVDLALVSIAGAWYALPAGELVESVSAARLTGSLGVVPYMCGYLSREHDVLIVLDVGPLLEPGSRAPRERAGKEVVVVRPSNGRRAFGLLVDALGDTPEVPVERLAPVPDTLGDRAGLIERFVRDERDAIEVSMLPLLSVTVLAGLAQGAPALAAGG